MGRKENNIAHIQFLLKKTQPRHLGQAQSARLQVGVKEKRPAARLRQHHLAEAGLCQKQGLVMNNTQRKLRANRDMLWREAEVFFRQRGVQRKSCRAHSRGD